MLSTTILLWALNLSATKYILEHGFQPLSYATVRYGLAGAVFVALALATEGSLRIERRHVGTLVVAAVILWLNQLAFVLALDVSAASKGSCSASPCRRPGPPTRSPSRPS